MAKVEAIKKLKSELEQPGFYTEISENFAEMLQDIPVISDTEEIEQILGKEIEFVGAVEGLKCDGWYYRNIHGHKKLKLLVGQPKNI